MDTLACYRRVWCLDFEFQAPPGGRPVPLCLVAREIVSGDLVRTWLTDGRPSPPYGAGPDELFVAYYSSAEWGCHLALGWPLSVRVLDLFAEFRNLTSGVPVPCGNGLLGALAFFGFDGIGATEKDGMRQLALRGGPFTDTERVALLDYCQSDVDALARLLPVMLPRIDLPRALLRGRYMVAVARMEHTGIPVDAKTLVALQTGWTRLKDRLVAELGRDTGVFVSVHQRTVDPGTTFGAAVLAEARAAGLDPHRLAEAVDHLWTAERESRGESTEARRAARKATGLTPRRIDLWEDSGKDHASIPRLDGRARELTRLHPALGIGPGYEGEAGSDATDYSARLCETLRDRDERPVSKSDPGLVRRAAELVASSGDAPPAGPFRFCSKRFAEFLARNGIPWPRLESGALDRSDDTFREMARTYPAEIGPIRELRHALSQLRLNELAVGPDGRHRCLLSPFGSRTGRNQPSNSRFVFGPSAWIRSLIRPGPGRAVAYVDWSQQELAIAAALSGDRRMQEAYTSGDFYLTFAKMAGAVPAGATKQTHGRERDQFKTVALGVLYGLSTDGLARKLNVSPAHGRELLRMHQETFRDFWCWSDAVEAEAILVGRLRTCFGWTVRVGPDANPRSLRNFPMQGHGAEMMRLAACLGTERGIAVCCPVHDAFLIEAGADEIEAEAGRMQTVMAEASMMVLPGFPLRTEAKLVRYPDRYTDPRGEKMWATVVRLLAEDAAAAVPP